MWIFRNVSLCFSFRLLFIFFVCCFVRFILSWNRHFSSNFFFPCRHWFNVDIQTNSQWKCSLIKWEQTSLYGVMWLAKAKNPQLLNLITKYSANSSTKQSLNKINCMTYQGQIHFYFCSCVFSESHSCKKNKHFRITTLLSRGKELICNDIFMNKLFIDAEVYLCVYI